jgi:hypothetical protein
MLDFSARVLAILAMRPSVAEGTDDHWDRMDEGLGIADGGSGTTPSTPVLQTGWSRFLAVEKSARDLTAGARIALTCARRFRSRLDSVFCNRIGLELFKCR